MAGEDEALWSVDHEAEEIGSTDPSDAVQDWLDTQEPEMALPDSVRVYAYVRLPARLDSERVLEAVLEWIDEEYGPPDDSSEPTPAMKDAADAFTVAILREYKSWQLRRKPELDRDVQVKGNPEFDAAPAEEKPDHAG